MNNRARRWGAATVAFLVIAGVAARSFGVAAQEGGGGRPNIPPMGPSGWTPPRTSDGQVDMQGYWNQRNNITTYSLQDGEGDRAEHVRITGGNAATGKPIVDPPNGRIPYQLWAAKLAQFLFDEHQGTERPENLDPVARGFMEGIPRINYQGGLQILQMPGQVVFLYEYGHHWRVVPVDGRPHLDENILLWMGDSRGHWEGNTLVIDTTNHNDQTWFDQVGSFHSTALRVTERWTMVGPHRIDWEVVIDDPKVFTQPWKMRLNYGRNTDPTYEHMESAVWEGNRAVELIVRPKQK
jgi:hypothetical protein